MSGQNDTFFASREYSKPRISAAKRSCELRLVH
jgi:hypothetical protein